MIKIFSLVAAAILILAACAQGGGSGVPDQAAGEGIDVHYIVTETETEELEIIDDEIAHEDFLTLEEEYNFGEENDFIEFYEPEKIDLTADDSLNETQEAEEEFHALEEEFFTPEDGLTTIDDGFLSDETYDDVFGNFVYEKVVNLEFKDAFKDVMYHPSGGYALIITAESKVLKFDPETKNLSLAADLKPVTLERIAFHPSGEYALIAGYASSQGRLIKITENGNGDFVTETIADASKDGALFRSVRFRQDGTIALIAASSESLYINYVLKYNHSSGDVSGFKGYNSSAGAIDLMWADPAILGGDFAVISEGINGADSHSWIEKTGEVIGNNFGASFGNPGMAGWRPGGSFGILTGRSSNIVYIYNGSWSKSYITGIGPYVMAIVWKNDGKRALILGTPYGASLKAPIFELRPKGNDFSSGDLIEQSIPSYDKSPYFATSSTFLLSLSFRPGVECDEGLIVGEDNGPSWSPTFGQAIIFRDTVYQKCGE